MQHLQFYDKPLRALFLGAHCDDIEIGCGGTLLKLIEKKILADVTWVTFASNPTRKLEALEAADMFLKGVSTKKIEVRDFRDGFLPYHAIELKEFFETLKRKDDDYDVVFTHFKNDRHQDHRFISDLTWNTFRNHLILEYEIPKYDGDMGVPNVFFDISEEQLKKKNELIIKAYQSQKSKHWFDNETFMALPRLRGMESATHFAEAFYGRKMCF